MKSLKIIGIGLLFTTPIGMDYGCHGNEKKEIRQVSPVTEAPIIDVRYKGFPVYVPSFIHRADSGETVASIVGREYPQYADNMVKRGKIIDWITAMNEYGNPGFNKGNIKRNWPVYIPVNPDSFLESLERQ
jgi:hypothetical protein